jgi:hypothetical protein
LYLFPRINMIFIPLHVHYYPTYYFILERSFFNENTISQNFILLKFESILKNAPCDFDYYYKQFT